MRFWLSVPMLLLLAQTNALVSSTTPSRDAACDVRELRFFNGFGLSLPPGVCVVRTSGPDYWIYQFTSTGENAPFLQAYVGNAANFPYFAPKAGMTITESPTGEKLLCDALLIRETSHGEVTQVGGSVTHDGKSCGEILVRATEVDGTISSPAVHFWYSDISTRQERIIVQIIDSVRRTEHLADDPPLKSGGAC